MVVAEGAMGQSEDTSLKPRSTGMLPVKTRNANSGWMDDSGGWNEYLLLLLSSGLSLALCA